MKKAIGFLGGQYGDALISLGLQKAFTDDHPECEFTFALSRKYSGILPLFEGQKHIHKLHIWEGYDDAWPSAEDAKFIAEEKFDTVFHPMQRQDPFFYMKCHQVTSVCRMYGYRDPDSDKISLNLPKPASTNMVGLSLFPNNGQGVKSLGLEKAAEIVSCLNKHGLEPMQFGGPDEPQIEGADRFKGSYIQAARLLHCARFVVTGDTGFSWLASAYDIPVVGLYARGYYPVAQNCKNWQPINEGSEYLEGFAANDIDNEEIFDAIGNLVKKTI